MFQISMSRDKTPSNAKAAVINSTRTTCSLELIFICAMIICHPHTENLWTSTIFIDTVLM